MIFEVIERILTTPDHLISVKVILPEGSNPVIKTIFKNRLVTCLDIQELHQCVVDKGVLHLIFNGVTLEPAIEQVCLQILHQRIFSPTTLFDVRQFRDAHVREVVNGLQLLHAPVQFLELIVVPFDFTLDVVLSVIEDDREF